MPDINITKTIFVDAQPVTPVNKPSSAFENAGTAVNVPEQKPEAAPALDNVVATSDDGDTVQARPESYERLSDGFVFTKTKEASADNKTDEKDADETQSINLYTAQKNITDTTEESDRVKDERIKEAIKESQEKATEARDILQDQAKEKSADEKSADLKAQNKINYSSLSDSELERMYLTGQISSYAYNSELESRKDKEDNAVKENEELSGKEISAGAELEANETLRQNITSENMGAGYETKEEQEVVRDALYGKAVEDNNNSNAAFEINLTK